MLEVNAPTENKVNFPAKQPRASGRFRTKQEMLRPKRRSNTLDLKKIRAWTQVGCTREEIATMLDVDLGWLNDAITKDYGLERAILEGFNDFKQSLRRTQAKLALAGHPGMLIWLGKQYLGQSDKQETKQETTVNVVLQRAMKELRELDGDTLLAMKKMIEEKETPQVSDASFTEVIES